jgi:hypothetical protein
MNVQPRQGVVASLFNLFGYQRVALVDSSLTLLNPPYVGYQHNFVGWIKRSESTKKRKVSRFTLVATYFKIEERKHDFLYKDKKAQSSKLKGRRSRGKDESSKLKDKKGRS